MLPIQVTKRRKKPYMIFRRRHWRPQTWVNLTCHWKKNKIGNYVVFHSNKLPRSRTHRTFRGGDGWGATVVAVMEGEIR